jgi:hypothetical protein
MSNKFTFYLINHRVMEPHLLPLVEEIMRDCAPDYFEIIKNPMDFATVQQKLDNKEYNSVEDWKADVLLIFSNSFTYNGKNSIIGIASKEYQNHFKDLTKTLHDDPSVFWYEELAQLQRNLRKHVMERISSKNRCLFLTNPDFSATNIHFTPVVLPFFVDILSKEEIEKMIEKLN